MAEKVIEKVVQYVGTSDVRVIYATDWKVIGIEHDDVVWHHGNNWQVPVNDLSEEVLEYCEKDRELVIKSV